MNPNLLLEKLQEYNEDELFYLNYHKHKTNPAHFQRFLSSLDPDYLKQRNLIIPELLPDEIPRLMMDSKYFQKDSTSSVFLCKHNRYTPPFWHTHVFFEIIYVLSGQCEHTLPNETFHLFEGDLCLLSPSVAHTIVVNDDSIVINILIRRETIEDIFFHTLRDHNIISDFMKNSIYLKNYATYLLFHTAHDPQIRQQILDMYMEQFMGDEFSDRLISSMLMIFFTKLVRKYKKTVETPSYSRQNIMNSSQLISYILEDYENISLASLAKKLNYSVPYCSRYIKKMTGFTFQQLLKQIRFQQAESLLLNTTLNIRSVSEKLGYENPESFIRSFKAEYGISPHQFRENKKES